MKIYTPFRFSLVYAMLFFTFSILAQSETAIIRGTVTDASTQEAIPFANVVLKNSANYVVAGATTDLDGNFTIDQISPGPYKLKVSFVGYASIVMDSIVLTAGECEELKLALKEESHTIQEVAIVYQAPMVDKTKSSQVSTTSIHHMAVRDISSTAAQSAGVTTLGESSIRSARSGGQVYFINGVKVRGSIKVPQAAIAQSEVISGGTPASLPTPEIAPEASPEKQGADLHLPENKTLNFSSEAGQWELVPNPPRESPSEHFDGENYKQIPENEFLGALYQPLSTFGADVDVASYANVRRMLKEGYWPHPDAVRLEELINYFSYDLHGPKPGDPFGLTIDQRPCDWNQKHQLLRIGLQTNKVPNKELAPSNLVFLIDVSGSMGSADKLPLLQSALRILVKNLREEDRVAIVVYASASGLVLESTLAGDKNKILEAIDQLQAGGSTAGGAGIKLAYKTARKHFDQAFNNRVILATDGDFNVGVTSEEGLIELIEKEREDGIFLSVLGFGTGNYQDAKMEQLADHGNGNYAYIDGLLEARKVLAEEMGANLHVVAKDTKFQIEFNPKQVAAYRLIGYENRLLAAKDFDDDSKDAGDIGAGHSLTVVYEIIPRGIMPDSLWESEAPLRYQDQSLKEQAYGDEIALLKIRYKDPKGKKSKLSIHPIKARSSEDGDFAFLSAVIQYGLILRRSEFAGEASLDEAIKLAQANLGEDPHGYRREFVKLCKLAKDLEPEEQDQRIGSR